MQDYFSKMQGMKGGPAPQQSAPAPGPMPGPMPGAMPQQQQGIDMSKAETPDKQLAKIVMKIIAALKEQGYYDLPENKDQGPKIKQEVEALAQAIVEGDDETVKASPIFKFITQKGGQRDVLREQAPEGGEANGTQG
jgi:hypothetical protein